VISSNNSDKKKEGVMLVHGFGASSTQWEKLIKVLEDNEYLAPDLLGFGHSEKPPITYSGYIWEAYIGDFIKEIAVHKLNWESFVIGGNSIGGFTCMSSAANDAILDDKAVSGSGSPGTGRCTGAVLMNPAGVIRSKQEIENLVKGNTENLLIESVAQITATDCLPPCKPIPRPIARAFGNGLLSYLRPRIQSICKNLYPTNPAAVDEALCSNILRDSLDPGAINVMVSGSKLPVS
jgi:pimeloyl-ACP methyl ester carboxylesterase